MFGIILNGILLGFGLAMDAFSVSLANGLSDPHMKRRKMLTITATFAAFQGAMPLIGWFFVTKLSSVFLAMQKFIPWVALTLLVFIGGKMLFEGLKPNEDECCEALSEKPLTVGELMV